MKLGRYITIVWRLIELPLFLESSWDLCLHWERHCLFSIDALVDIFLDIVALSRILYDPWHYVDSIKYLVGRSMS